MDQTVQDMSEPQHIGDLILPWPLGHCETPTLEPSSFVTLAFTSAASQEPQVMLTDILHVGHVYRAMLGR